MHRRAALRVALAVTAVGCSLLAAGCGSGGSPEVASVGTSSPAPSPRQSGVHPSAVAYATCMTAHGVAMAQPDTRHGLTILGDISPSSAQFGAAARACRTLDPAGGPQPLTPGQQAQAAEAVARFATCMRKHNVPDFPDPNSEGALPESKVEALNTNSPFFRDALKSCDHLYPERIAPRIAFPGGSHT
jgi:hypothetical protein